MKHLLCLLLVVPTLAALAEEAELPPALAAKQTGPIELDAKAEAALKKEIEALTVKYLEHLDAGEYTDAYLLFDPIAKEVLPIDRWIDQQKADQQRWGERKSLDIWRLKVDRDPQNAPSRGNYIVVDYDSEFENMPLACGYVVWYQNLRGDLTIMREEKGYIAARRMKDIEAEELALIKEQIGCRPD